MLCFVGEGEVHSGIYLLLNLKAVGGVGNSGALTVAISKEHSGTGVQQLAEAIIRPLKPESRGHPALSLWHTEFRSSCMYHY